MHVVFLMVVLVGCVLGVEMDLILTCGQNCTTLLIDGQTNPSLGCNVGDTILFTVDTGGVPVYIKTARTTGGGELWNQVENNGGTTMRFKCNMEAKLTKLYYQSGTSETAGGNLCVGKPCGATVCSNEVCWGSKPRQATPLDVAQFIADLAGDFSWYFESLDGVTSWSWKTDWSQDAEEKAWFVTVSYLRTKNEVEVLDMIIGELANLTGLTTDWFDIVVREDGGVVGVSTASLVIYNPTNIEPPNYGGFIDLIFFGGLAESLDEELVCRIHTTCLHSYKKRYCYRYLNSNRIGEYSGDNHIRENQCVANPDSNWGWSKVVINDDRDGGEYFLQCDNTCNFCRQTGTFKGDECVCYIDKEHPEAAGYPYYCISAKYASAGVITPSVIAFLLLELVFHFWC